MLLSLGTTLWLALAPAAWAFPPPVTSCQDPRMVKAIQQGVLCETSRSLNGCHNLLPSSQPQDPAVAYRKAVAEEIRKHKSEMIAALANVMQAEEGSGDDVYSHARQDGIKNVKSQVQKDVKQRAAVIIENMEEQLAQGKSLGSKFVDKMTLYFRNSRINVNSAITRATEIVTGQYEKLLIRTGLRSAATSAAERTASRVGPRAAAATLGGPGALAVAFGVGVFAEVTDPTSISCDDFDLMHLDPKNGCKADLRVNGNVKRFLLLSEEEQAKALKIKPVCDYYLAMYKKYSQNRLNMPALTAMSCYGPVKNSMTLEFKSAQGKYYKEVVEMDSQRNQVKNIRVKQGLTAGAVTDAYNLTFENEDLKIVQLTNDYGMQAKYVVGENTVQQYNGVVQKRIHDVDADYAQMKGYIPKLRDCCVSDGANQTACKDFEAITRSQSPDSQETGRTE